MIDFEKALSLLERIDPKYKQHIQMLNESQIINEADSRLKAVDRIIDQVFSKYFNPDDTVRSSEYYVNDNPNTTWRQYLLFNLRHTFGLMQNSDVKYLPVVARLAYSDEVRFDIANDNGEQINTLIRIVNLLKKDANLFNEVKSNPNITFGQLAERFKEAFAQEDTEDARKANEVDSTNSEYTVKEVPDFETANYYGNKSCSISKLCYTQSENTWDSYTDNGKNRVYVCLRNGWENIPEEPTEGNPYDLYGTSMIFVFVNPMGNLVTSNCRWNHNNKGDYDGDVDHAFTKSTLSQTIGMPFDGVFNNLELHIDDNSISKAVEKGDYKLLRKLAVGDFVIPDGTRVIGDEAFDGCTKLTSITIPNTVKSIGKYAFMSCINLTSVTIPNSVTEIGGSAFYKCTNLTRINIPNSVTRIRQGAFGGCNSLTNVTIPKSVTSIEDGIFRNCRGLTSVFIPDSVTSIGRFAFAYCTSLTSVTIPNSVTSIGFAAFSECENLTSVTIPNSVTTIGDAAFISCYSLTSVNIPNGVKSIGDETFSECIRLTSVTIPNTVTVIEDEAFSECESLTSVTIPNSVTKIGVWAFSNCESLTSITINATIPPKLSTYYPFPNINFPIYVPAKSVNAYKTAEVWSEYYANRIQPIPTK